MEFIEMKAGIGGIRINWKIALVDGAIPSCEKSKQRKYNKETSHKEAVTHKEEVVRRR